MATLSSKIAPAGLVSAADLNTDVDTHLNTGTASSGEYLSWTGSDYDWVAVSGYTDADVDTHLNTGTASSGEVLSWNGTDYDWIAVSSGATDINGLSDAATSSTGVSLGSSTAAYSSVIVGLLNSTSTQYSTIVGYQANRNSASGANSNVAVGENCLTGLTSSGDNNVALGRNAIGGYRASPTRTSTSNVAVGYGSMESITNAIRNVAIGDQAASGLTTGSNNTIIGNWAARLGGITTGSSNIAIGSGVNPSSATVSNEITLGGSGITRFRVPGAGIDNTSAALSGTTPSVDVGARDTYTLSTSGNTTFTFTGVPSSGQVGTFSLIITAGGTHTLTWPASVDWAGGTAPDAPASGEKDIYTFMTVDGGTTWYGFLAGDAMA